MRKKTRLVFGVGINDANYAVQPRLSGGGRGMCPAYQAWAEMFRRCYCAKFNALNPTYIGCSVTPEWHSFMTFREWMLMQDWRGKQLDKDILVEGNKLYSPQNCVFVDNKTNSLLTDHAAARGDLPVGVRAHGGRYVARCRKNGMLKHIGVYDTPEQASTAYKEFKAEVIMEAALRQTNTRAQDALFLRALTMMESQLIGVA